jgi:energy-coupling factor transporter ATP-binding protein EcfA2
MRLISAKVSGYRRLANPCEIKLNTDPVCIVGPNAAGKSSLLDALAQLNHEDEFPPRDRTRVPQGAPMDPSVEARFELTQADKACFSDVAEAAKVTQLCMRKAANGEISYFPEPEPRRDEERRRGVGVALDELKGSRWTTAVGQIEPQMDPAPERSIGELLDGAIEAAASSSANLGGGIDALTALRERLREIDAEQRQETERKAASEDEGEEQVIDESHFRNWPPLPKKYEKLIAALDDLVAYERATHPRVRVIEALQDRVPEFVKFTDVARELGSVYDLENEDPPPAGAALHNLLTLADTSWAEMLEVMQSGDPGRKEAYEETLNELLEQRVALTWEASELRVKARIDGTTLTILMSMQAHDYVTFDMHSDGLRQFVALRAFLAREGREIPPIILIDEAETHLHYDAQADVVAVFEDQKEAAQIIYTTHSAGCLPRDLGLAIRAIVPEVLEDENGVEKPGDHSRVINKFWSEGRGYSPLLLAMGAGALAFSATQKAVVTEGMSDVILLPTLIREATGKERLSYQAAPSFAEAGQNQLCDLDLIAARIAFLADGDGGGADHVEQLLESGILDEQIRYLGDSPESGLSVEDLLRPDLYLEAVNGELGTWQQLEYPQQELPPTGRSKAVDDWCKERTQELDRKIKVSKVDVAQRVLDRRDADDGLLDPQYRDLLIELDAAFEQIFEDAPSRVARLKQQLAEAKKEIEAAAEAVTT